MAAIVATHLRDHDIQVVLVGGLAVELYSENVYLTQDIDMVDISYAKPAKLHKVMAGNRLRETRSDFCLREHGYHR